MEKFSVLDLLNLELKAKDDLSLRCLGGRRGLTREIPVAEFDHPGLALGGFFEDFNAKRIQILGKSDMAYVSKLEREGTLQPIDNLFRYGSPCFVFADSANPGDAVLDIAETRGMAVLQSSLGSSEFSARLVRALSQVFAPRETRHGTLMEVSGIGILLQGESGVGKSETALELIKRGHRLVADDIVIVRRVSETFLIGSGTDTLIGHHMEIRGLGIISVAQLYGVGAIRDKKKIHTVIHLEEWNPKKVYDRIGLEDTHIEILGRRVPYHCIPVKPGRNISMIVETAALNERLKELGYHTAKEFSRKAMHRLEREEIRKYYLNQNKGKVSAS